MHCLCQLANYDQMRSSSASPSNCQGRLHATPWLRVMKRQCHKASCQVVLLHLYNLQTNKHNSSYSQLCLILGRRKTPLRHRRMLGSIPERHRICVDQLWPFLKNPSAFCPFAFSFFLLLLFVRVCIKKLNLVIYIQDFVAGTGN